jgi:acyl CoA:acetate/3-ketoacid CoA transferase beta subunit
MSKGEPKILERCSLPLTGKGVVDMLITEMAVFKFDYDTKEPEMTLIEMAPGLTLEQIKKNTGCEFKVSPNLKEF